MRWSLAVLTAAGALALAGCSASGSSSPTTTTTKPAATGSLTSPIPFGTIGAVQGWRVKVISVTPETTDPVVGSPPAGYDFEVLTYQVTRTGSSPEAPILLNPVLTGSWKTERSVDSSPMCDGGTPDNDDVLKGGTAQSSDCISVPSSGAGHLLVGFQGDDLLSRSWFEGQ